MMPHITMELNQLLPEFLQNIHLHVLIISNIVLINLSIAIEILQVGT